MIHSAALPFFLRRSHDVVAVGRVTKTLERIHGLLRVDGERVTVQWRVAREVSHVGGEIRTDHEFEPVREVVLPLASLAGAAVHWRGRNRIRGPRFVLTAADLRAFEEIAGAAGLRLEHPAQLVLRIRRADILAAQEFAATLNLAVAEHSPLPAGERAPARRLGPGPDAPGTALDEPATV